jgi:hypothetical protein
MATYNSLQLDAEKKRPKRGRLPLALHGWLAVTVGVAALAYAATASATSIATEKVSYAVGDYITIIGEKWQPQEDVMLIFSNSAGTRSSALQIVAGQDGSFRNGSYMLKDIDRDQLVTVTARGQSGAETMVAFRAGVAPGSLRCVAAATSSSQYVVSPGQKVTCTIEGAADLTAAQQSGSQPVEVVVKWGSLGNLPAQVTSVTGTDINFSWTPPPTLCGLTTVSYGPIRACHRTYGACATLPVDGNEVNNFVLSGGIGGSAAGFVVRDANVTVASTCSAGPQLKAETFPKNGSFTAESQLAYTIVVSNPAVVEGAVATGVVLDDALPGNGGLVWDSVTTSQGTCENPVAGNALKCSLGDIPPQGSVTVTVHTATATPAAACQHQPDAVAVKSTAGGVTAAVSGSLSCTPLAPAKLSVAMSPASGSFAPGEQVIYRMYITNQGFIGSQVARNVRLRDQLPGNGGLTWSVVSTSIGQCSLSDNLLSCSLGDLKPQGAALVIVKSTPVTTLEACQDQPNLASVMADGGVTAEGSGFITCTTGGPPQLTVATDPENGQFTSGSQLSSTITVRNSAPAGSAAARGIRVTTQLPGEGDLLWTSVNVSQGGCTVMSNRLDCSLGILAPGASATIVVSTPSVTPATACAWQERILPLVVADGGYSTQGNGGFKCATQACAPSGISIPNVSWNEFDIPERTAPVVWVHAHLGSVTLPEQKPVKLTFTNGRLTLSNGLWHRLPDGVVTFDSRAPEKATTAFAGNRWETLVNPKYLTAETFFSGAAIPVSQGIASGAKATITFDVYSDAPTSFSWQWSAAVYTGWPADIKNAGINASHIGYHAGAPTDPTVQKSLIPGPRGGGGSNFTGSWSSTGNGTSYCKYVEFDYD